MQKYHYILLWPLFYIGVVYASSVVVRFGSVQSTLASDFSPTIKFLLLANLPLEVLYNASTVTGALFMINTALVTTYLALLIYLIHSRVARYKKAMGAAGSVLALLSVGCAACGSLITPALIAVSSIVPLSLFGYINTVLSILSAMLLLFAISFLVKRIRG